MADAHFNIANIYFEAGQYRLAIAHYRHALELRPNWEKAHRGLVQSEQALAEPDDEEAITEVNEQLPETSDSAPLDPNRVVDPEAHGNVLRLLHQTTIDLHNQGTQFLEMLVAELEPSIKELSILLLTPTTSPVVLERCLARFEQTVATFLSQQADLRARFEKVRQGGEQLLKT